MKKRNIFAALFVASCSLAMAQTPTTFGVGINNPVGTLHVHSAELILPDDPFNQGRGDTVGGRDLPVLEEYYNTIVHITNGTTGSGSSDGFTIDQYDNDVTLRQYENGKLTLQNHNGKIIMTSGGKVGIGATNSDAFHVEGSTSITGAVTLQSTLSVTGNVSVNGNALIDANGGVKVKSLRVTLTDWPDYVFSESHRQMPLCELERYIAERGHLPDVPAAAEVEQEGVDVGAMNKVLLQKVEELTLYIIDLQKQIDNLKTNK